MELPAAILIVGRIWVVSAICASLISSGTNVGGFRACVLGSKRSLQRFMIADELMHLTQHASESKSRVGGLSGCNN